MFVVFLLQCTHQVYKYITALLRASLSVARRKKKAGDRRVAHSTCRGDTRAPPSAARRVPYIRVNARPKTT